MLGAITVTTFCYYVFSFLFGLGMSLTEVYVPWGALIASSLLAGFLGGVQYVRTEARKLRVIGSLTLTFKSCLAIVLTPLAINFVLSLAQMLSFGFGMLFALPDLAAFMTLAAFLGLVSILLSSFTLIFIGVFSGQWLRGRQLLRRSH